MSPQQLSLRGTAFTTVQAVVDMPALYRREFGGPRPLGACPSCRQNTHQPLLARPHVRLELTKAGLWRTRAECCMFCLGRDSECLGLRLGQGKSFGPGERPQEHRAPLDCLCSVFTPNPGFIRAPKPRKSEFCLGELWSGRSSWREASWPLHRQSRGPPEVPPHDLFYRTSGERGSNL